MSGTKATRAAGIEWVDVPESASQRRDGYVLVLGERFPMLMTYRAGNTWKAEVFFGGVRFELNDASSEFEAEKVAVLGLRTVTRDLGLALSAAEGAA